MALLSIFVRVKRGTLILVPLKTGRNNLYCLIVFSSSASSYLCGMNESYSVSSIHGIHGASSMATNHSIPLEPFSNQSSLFAENASLKGKLISPSNSSNGSDIGPDNLTAYHICEWILYRDIPKTG